MLLVNMSREKTYTKYWIHLSVFPFSPDTYNYPKPEYILMIGLQKQKKKMIDSFLKTDFKCVLNSPL